jgi:hypothetical protein
MTNGIVTNLKLFFKNVHYYSLLPKRLGKRRKTLGKRPKRLG